MAESTTQEPQLTNYERRIGGQYLREFAPAVVGYVVVVVVLVLTIDVESTGSWKYLAMAAPLVPWLFGARAVLRHLRRVDERARTIQLTGMAVGFAVAAGVSLVLGFMSIAGLDTDPWGYWLVFSSAMAAWAVSAGTRTCA